MLEYLTRDEWLFVGLLLVIIYGVGVTPRVARRIAGLRGE